MIKHIVFFNLLDNAEGKTKLEHAKYLKTALENLKNLIPELITIEVGINHESADNSNYDLSLYTEFASIDDLGIYQNHPEHKKVGSYIAKIKTARACVDYEV
jgi:hypothetical protein